MPPPGFSGFAFAQLRRFAGFFIFHVARRTPFQLPSQPAAAARCRLRYYFSAQAEFSAAVFLQFSQDTPLLHSFS